MNNKIKPCNFETLNKTSKEMNTKIKTIEINNVTMEICNEEMVNGKKLLTVIAPEQNGICEITQIEVNPARVAEHTDDAINLEVAATVEVEDEDYFYFLSPEHICNFSTP